MQYSLLSDKNCVFSIFRNVLFELFVRSFFIFFAFKFKKMLLFGFIGVMCSGHRLYGALSDFSQGEEEDWKRKVDGLEGWWMGWCLRCWG